MKEKLYNIFTNYSSQDLIEIWVDNNRDYWQDLAFDVIKNILIERKIKLPVQTEYIRKENIIIFDNNTIERLKSLPIRYKIWHLFLSIIRIFYSVFFMLFFISFISFIISLGNIFDEVTNFHKSELIYNLITTIIFLIIGLITRFIIELKIFSKLKIGNFIYLLFNTNPTKKSNRLFQYANYIYYNLKEKNFSISNSLARIISILYLIEIEDENQRKIELIDESIEILLRIEGFQKNLVFVYWSLGFLYKLKNDFNNSLKYYKIYLKNNANDLYIKKEITKLEILKKIGSHF